MKTCPQCGAPIEPYNNKCSYCGVYYFDFSAFDCTKDCYIKFKTSINGQEYILTALARPNLEEAVVSSETTYLSDSIGTCLHCSETEVTCELRATFTCIADPKKKSLLQVEVEEQ